MADDGDIIVLNNNLGTFRSRKTKSGKERMRVVFKSEPVVFNLSPKVIGGAVAKSMAHTLRSKITGIASTAAAATLKYREKASKAVSAGKRWAMKRYSGGRIGAMSPNQSNRLFNDSGRFAKSVTVGATKNSWVVNVAANRLDPSTFSVGRFEAMLAQLVSLVPEFGSTEKLMESETVQVSLKDAIQAIASKMPGTLERVSEIQARLYSQRTKEWLKLAKEIAEILAAA